MYLFCLLLGCLGRDIWLQLVLRSLPDFASLCRGPNVVRVSVFRPAAAACVAAFFLRVQNIFFSLLYLSMAGMAQASFTSSGVYLV